MNVKNLRKFGIWAFVILGAVILCLWLNPFRESKLDGNIDQLSKDRVELVNQSKSIDRDTSAINSTGRDIKQSSSNIAESGGKLEQSIKSVSLGQSELTDNLEQLRQNNLDFEKFITSH